MKSRKNKLPEIAFIGAGRLARAFIPELRTAGYTISNVAARTTASARRACRLAPGATAWDDISAAPWTADLVMLAIPDAAIAPVARKLAGAGQAAWRGKIVLHHAGALGPEELLPLKRCKAAVGLLHPLQSLGESTMAGGLLRECRARVEGDPKARAAARRIARDLGIVPLRLRSPLSAEERIIYHAAASMLSNDLIALLSVGSGLLESLGLDRRAALQALSPLIRGTVLQAERKGFGAALTGPVVRGDVETVTGHLRMLSRRSRGGERIHRELSAQLLRLAELEGIESPRQARRRLKRLLRPDAAGR